MLITAISDTHNTYPELPGGDLLLHAGDFSSRGRKDEVMNFMEYLQKQTKKYSYVVFCAGNHELTFQDTPGQARAWIAPYLSDRLVYLQEKSVSILGFKIYAAPHTPWFGDLAFNVRRGVLHYHWDKIPQDTDILVTHGPPEGIGDFVPERTWSTESNSWTDTFRQVGCAELLEAVVRVKPKLHVFGHIHCAYGRYEGTGLVAGTTFINASSVNEGYEQVNPPVQISL
jgi:predicted phosphodiesterase